MKYSVLMSLYIKEKPSNLIKSIESMLNQTVKPDEIVIVLDGPITLELNKIIENYKNLYPKLFHIIISEKNLGLGLALNLGLKKCRNEYIARMDTDDISNPKRCEMQLEVFKNNPNISIVGGNISEFIGLEQNIVGIRAVPTEDKEIKDYLTKRCPFNHVTVMFKKSEVLNAGNYLDWFWNEDYYLWIRMYEKGCNFNNIPDILVNVRVGNDMYKRRGGIKYFRSEAGLQKYMYKKSLIHYKSYLYNVSIRFILQVLMPSSMRAIIFKKFARE